VWASWIPGASGGGQFRYKIFADPEIFTSAKELTLTAPGWGWGIPAYVTKLHACSYTLEVFDSEGFGLQRIPLIFSTTVGDDGFGVGISSNDLSPMPLGEYKSFLQATHEDAWNIKWVCP
jgi:hypothetical protein